MEEASKTAVRRWSDELAAAGVRVHLDQDGLAGLSWRLPHADSDRVMDNLFSNALRWLPKDREQWIAVHVDGDRMLFSDAGPGVDDPDVFDFGVTHHPDGLGHGLAGVRDRLAANGLEIRLGQSDDPRTPGATFVIGPTSGAAVAGGPTVSSGI